MHQLHNILEPSYNNYNIINYMHIYYTTVVAVIGTILVIEIVYTTKKIVLEIMIGGTEFESRSRLQFSVVFSPFFSITWNTVEKFTPAFYILFGYDR